MFWCKREGGDIYVRCTFRYWWCEDSDKADCILSKKDELSVLKLDTMIIG